jgi:uncharacterized protein DUF1566
MPQPSFRAKEMSGSRSDRLIRVLAANQNSDGFHALTFPENEIQGVADMGQDRSALVLRSGIEIPVTLPYEQLEQRIYQPDFRNDGPVLDLRDLTGDAARKPAAVIAIAAPAGPKAGDKMPDGTIYAGISPDTRQPMYTTPADAPLTMKWKAAMKYAKKLDAHGRQDWRVPTKRELNVLFNNRAAIGGFNLSGSDPAGWYWSGTQGNLWSAWGQRFSGGGQDDGSKGNRSSVRCVR